MALRVFCGTWNVNGNLKKLKCSDFVTWLSRKCDTNIDGNIEHCLVMNGL